MRPPIEPDAERHGEGLRLRSAGSEAFVALTGGQLIAWRVDGRDLLWGGDPDHWEWHAPVLFPVVGQVARGTVRIQGRSYPMPRHGFARISRFHCLDHAADRARLRLDRSTADTSFPLAFALDLMIALGPRSLSVAFTVRNPGPEVLPYALGLHPAFPWPFHGGEPTEYGLRFEAVEQPRVPVVTPDGFLRRETRAIPLAGDRLMLAPDLFREDALVFLNAGSRWMRFEAPDGAAITLSVDNFPHLAAWTKPTSPFLSLEAWTGYSDPDGFDGDFTAKPSMILLPPGAEMHHRVEMRFAEPGAR